MGDIDEGAAFGMAITPVAKGSVSMAAAHTLEIILIMLDLPWISA